MSGTSDQTPSQPGTRPEWPEPLPVAVRMEGLRGPTGLSPSSMSSFLNCPLAFYFRSVARITEPATEQSTLGQFVHAILERLLRMPAHRRTKEEARRIAKELFPAFSAEEGFAQLGLDEDQAKAWRWRAWLAVDGYFANENPAAVMVEGIEQYVSETVGGVPVRGVVDRLERDDEGRLTLTDYKTGRVPTAGWGVSRLEQLHFYALIIELIRGERPTHVKLLFANAEEPVVIRGKVTDAKCDATRTTIIDTWAAIQAALKAETFTARPNRLCEYCSHRPYCPAWGGSLDDAPAATAEDTAPDATPGADPAPEPRPLACV